MLQSNIAALLLAAGASAHFTVQDPQTVGPLMEETEGNAPCGGYQPAQINNLAFNDFHAGGDAIGSTSTHPQTDWLYRITTDLTAGGNWTQIYHGIVQQTGAGEFCAQGVTIPPQFVGQKAILSVVANGPDGLLYQCAAVNIVSGTVDTPSNCFNDSKITATYTNDAQLSALVSNGTSAPTTSNPASPTKTPNAAPSLHTVATGGFGALLTTGFMVLAGLAFMA